MKRKVPPQNRPNHFEIYPDGIITGKHWLKELMKKTPAIVILDEIGYFELAGMVWHDEFLMMAKANFPLIFSTNHKNLKAITGKWNIQPSAIITPVEFNTPENTLVLIEKLLTPHISIK
jgi:nucleoside-triphosphatase THEP1